MSAVQSRTALVAGLLAALIVGAPARAETTNRSETAASGKSVRILVASNLKKDCSAGATPEIRISVSPANGSLITKAGKLKTPASHACPNKETAVQAVFYQSKPSFTGTDDVTIEVKNADGQVQTQAIKITVGSGGDKKDGAAKKDGTAL